MFLHTWSSELVCSFCEPFYSTRANGLPVKYWVTKMCVHIFFIRSGSRRRFETLIIFNLFPILRKSCHSKTCACDISSSLNIVYTISKHSVGELNTAVFATTKSEGQTKRDIIMEWRLLFRKGKGKVYSNTISPTDGDE